jgi:hypothetical protein
MTVITIKVILVNEIRDRGLAYTLVYVQKLLE